MARGISKVNAKFDLWMKDIAPSNNLRQWFNHDPIIWDEFQSKYIHFFFIKIVKYLFIN